MAFASFKPSAHWFNVLMHQRGRREKLTCSLSKELRCTVLAMEK
jgi:hypothetical protein